MISISGCFFAQTYCFKPFRAIRFSQIFFIKFREINFSEILSSSATSIFNFVSYGITDIGTWTSFSIS
jgi:hypothetical protein